jgi:ATP-dependent protease ClpP protease subunit
MTDSAEASPPQPNKEVYGIFAGVVDQIAVGKVANAAAITSGTGVTHCHMAFQTMGGSVQDGIALYNIFKTFPIPITLYNVGSIASAGVIAYMGAADRASSALATFMIHRTVSTHQGMSSERLRAAVRSVELDDERTEQVFKAIQLTEADKAVHKIADLWLSASEAKTAGLVTRIAEFAPPKGTNMFYLGPS